MLCEVCHEKEATVRITRIHNGNSETHNLCQSCANSFRPDDAEGQDLSKMIFQLFADALMKHLGGQNVTPAEDERVKKIACPSCKKTYGEVLEEGKFGCGDCYETFEPYLRPVLMRIQGAETHTGQRSASASKKKAPKKEIVDDKLTREEELNVLTQRMNLAVSEENYEEAARLRDEIKALREAERG